VRTTDGVVFAFSEAIGPSLTGHRLALTPSRTCSLLPRAMATCTGSSPSIPAGLCSASSPGQQTARAGDTGKPLMSVEVQARLLLPNLDQYNDGR